MKKTVIAVVGLIFVSALSWYLWSQRLKPGTVAIGKTVLSVEIVDTLPKQIQGLSGRDSLCKTCGMLFIFSQAQIQQFWMYEMKFPLDIIFIRDGKIQEIASDQPAPRPGADPARVTSQEPANMVLELNAGAAAKFGFKIGDVLRMSKL